MTTYAELLAQRPESRDAFQAQVMQALGAIGLGDVTEGSRFNEYFDGTGMVSEQTPTYSSQALNSFFGGNVNLQKMPDGSYQFMSPVGADQYSTNKHNGVWQGIIGADGAVSQPSWQNTSDHVSGLNQYAPLVTAALMTYGIGSGLAGGAAGATGAGTGAAGTALGAGEAEAAWAALEASGGGFGTGAAVAPASGGLFSGIGGGTPASGISGGGLVNGSTALTGAAGGSGISGGSMAGTFNGLTPPAGTWGTTAANAASTATTSPNWWDMLGRAGSSVLQQGIASNGARQQVDIASGNKDALMALAQQVAGESRFSPVNVNTSFAGTDWQVDPATGRVTSASAKLNPQMQSLIDQAMSKGEQTMAGVGAGTPQEIAQAEYQRYLDYARPQQESLFGQLQERMGAQGTMGYQTGGASNGYNPMLRDFAKGIREADYTAYSGAQRLGQELTNSNLARAQSLFGTGLKLDATGQDVLKLGADMGKLNQNTAGAQAMLTAGINGQGGLNTAQQAQAQGNTSFWGNVAQASAPLISSGAKYLWDLL